MKTNSYIVVRVFEKYGNCKGLLLDERKFDSSTPVYMLKKELLNDSVEEYLYYQIIARTDDILEEF